MDGGEDDAGDAAVVAVDHDAVRAPEDKLVGNGLEEHRLPGLVDDAWVERSGVAADDATAGDEDAGAGLGEPAAPHLEGEPPVAQDVAPVGAVELGEMASPQGTFPEMTHYHDPRTHWHDHPTNIGH